MTTKKTKRVIHDARVLFFFGLYNFFKRRLSRKIILEAAGIEPASEDIQQSASTCLSSSSVSFCGVRRGKTPLNQPRKSFACQAQDQPGSLSCLSAFLRNRRRVPKKRHAYFLGSNGQIFCTSVFHLFTRWVESRHATSTSLSPSNPVRPRLSELNYIQLRNFCQYELNSRY